MPANLLRREGHGGARPVSALRRLTLLAGTVLPALLGVAVLSAAAPAGPAAVAVGGAHAGLACGECHRSGSRPTPDGRVPPLGVQDVAASCGRCHQAQLAAYQASSHARSATAGDDRLAPTCVSCHGSHTVLPVDKGAGSDFASRI